jgi:HEAT repeat protein
MSWLESLLIGGSVVAAIAWAALVGYLLVIQRRRRVARALVSDALGILQADGVRTRPLSDRIAAARHILARSSREMLMYAAADGAVSAEVFDVLSAYLTERWNGRLELDAAAHRTARDKWRRLTALRILYRLNHPNVLPLLERAIDERDSELADAGFALLGQSADPRAMDILIAALKRQRHSAARIASHIEHSQQPIADRLKALLHDTDPAIRFWGATLLARYPDADVELTLATLTRDADPRVRKAALQTLGRVGGELAADCASRLLNDTEPFVRAHAARALGELERSDLAAPVAVLLGDENWWTRLAARESLEMMGTEVWPVLMRCLGHDDGFVRNGAAEVLQNIGVLDSLIVMEAASDSPAAEKVALLRRIAAAGGVRFTDSLVERAGPAIGPRIRALLGTMGLDRVDSH